MRKLLIALILPFSLEAFAASEKSSLDSSVQALLSELPKMDHQILETTLGKEWVEVLFRTELDPQNVLRADFQHIEAVLDAAVRSQADILDLMTLKELSVKPGAAILLDSKLLQEIDARYNLHSVWQINPEAKDSSGRPLRMRFMLVGQGVLVIGYPHAATVEVVDGGPGVEYQYEPLTIARILNQADKRGLFSLKTLAARGQDFGEFKGPMGVQIKAYQIQGDKIRVTYQMVVDQETEVPRKPIEPRDSKNSPNP